MKTTSKKKATVTRVAKQTPKQKSEQVELLVVETKRIDLDLIDFSPFNKRKFFNQKALEELAADIAVHDLIQDVTVREKQDKRFELVVGERRIRAARIAGLKTVPAKIVAITDDLVKEFIFSENAHRENPHPMDDAALIADMQADGKSTKEIALRLCKSESFVLGRSKLIALIEPFQEMFVADKMSLHEALQIATLAADSQQEFFDDNCAEWKEDGDFELDELNYALRQYTYDLNRAPFDIKDKKLVTDVGACSRCPFNTATMTTLFPDEAKQAICTNRSCYHRKCNALYHLKLATLFTEKPDAIVISTGMQDTLKKAIETFPEAAGLPVYDRYNVSIVDAPKPTDKDDYTHDGEEGTEEYFDETGFKQAEQEYQNDLDEYHKMIQSGSLIKALQISSSNAEIVYLLNGKNAISQSAAKQTAKEVQEAVKTGAATPELLQGEIARLQQKEKRAKELDIEKVQLKVHGTFNEHISKLTNNKESTPADHIAARLLVYQSLDYTGREQADKVLGIKGLSTNEELYQFLSNITDIQYCYLIRTALAGKSESKYPNNITAHTLYQTASAAGIDVQAIETAQQEKAIEREKTCNQRIEDIQAMIKEMQDEAAA